MTRYLKNLILFKKNWIIFKFIKTRLSVVLVFKLLIFIVN
jgi:hypothetical protein